MLNKTKTKTRTFHLFTRIYNRTRLYINRERENLKTMAIISLISYIIADFIWANANVPTWCRLMLLGLALCFASLAPEERETKEDILSYNNMLLTIAMLIGVAFGM